MTTRAICAREEGTWPSRRHGTPQSSLLRTRRISSTRCRICAPCGTTVRWSWWGEDVFLWDSDGKRYIDAFAGLWNVNVGHGRAELADVASAQIREVAFVPNFFGLVSPPPIELATRLATLFPGDLNHFQFTSGGAESNETALKIARYYWWLKGRSDKVKILSRKMAYHGIAMGALAATGIPTYHEGFGPNVPGFVHLTPPYQYRHGEGMSEDEFIASLVRELEETIEREGADTIAAMIGEPVQGSGGVVVPPQGYWAAIAPVLKKHDILLIFDEVICGWANRHDVRHAAVWRHA